MKEYDLKEYERYRSSVSSKKKQKRRRTRSLLLILLIIVILIFIGVAGGLYYFYSHYSSVRGNWENQIDYTEEISSRIALWMSDIEGSKPDLSWVKSHGDNITLSATMEINMDSLNSGFYKVYIDEESYKEAVKNADKLLSDCLTDVILSKLVEKGYKDNLSNEEVTSLVNEVLGSSLEDYIKANGLSLMPSYEEINNKISDEGTINLKFNYITKINGEGSKKESYIIDKDTLILPDQSLIYRKKVVK